MRDFLFWFGKRDKEKNQCFQKNPMAIESLASGDPLYTLWKAVLVRIYPT